MARTRRTESSSAYSEAEFDQEFLRSQRSDPVSVLVRLLTVALVFGLMARAIVVHQVSAAFLLVPVAAEWLLTLWTGVLLSRTLVNCPAFRKEANRPGLAIGWTIFLLAVSLLVAAWQADGFSLSAAPAAWAAGAAELWRTGLVFAVFAEAVGLWLATLPEVRRWRATGGKFLWSAAFSQGMRVAALILLLFPIWFVGIATAELIGPWSQSPSFRSWLTFGILLAIELAAITITVVLHRSMKKKAAKPSQR
ncbi:MAG: hypothetical protein AAGA23_20075 [Pseudomonadota bacterium]